MDPLQTLIRKSTRDMSRNELTHHVTQLREALRDAEADRDVLAAEVIKWRTRAKRRNSWRSDELAAAQRTDKSGALTRAKEVNSPNILESCEGEAPNE